MFVINRHFFKLVLEIMEKSMLSQTTKILQTSGKTAILI